MKLLRIISSMHPKNGGPCQGIRSSIPAFQQLGIESEVLCLDDPSEDFIAKDPFVIHALGAAKGVWSYHSGLKVWLELCIAQYDAVIIHGLWSFHSYAVTKVVRQRKKKSLSVPKVYVMPHGMLDPWFQRDKSRRLKALRNEIYWRWIEKRVINQADALLFTCQQELLLARMSFKGYQPKQEINIGYGIAPPPAYHADMPVPTANPYWLFLSRLHPKKGVDLLVKAYQRIQNEHIQLPDLVIAGPGMDTSYGQALIQLTKGNTGIHFTGMLQGEAKWGAIYGCEAFVLPSHQENFGIAVVEALACGKPVLISDQVNIWREIKEGDGGIVAPDTESGAYQLLHEYSSMDENKKKEMGNNARKVYEDHFTIEKAAERLRKVLEG